MILLTVLVLFVGVPLLLGEILHRYTNPVPDMKRSLDCPLNDDPMGRK
jgi:hypothetical protein